MLSRGICGITKEKAQGAFHGGFRVWGFGVLGFGVWGRVLGFHGSLCRGFHVTSVVQNPAFPLLGLYQDFELFAPWVFGKYVSWQGYVGFYLIFMKFEGCWFFGVSGVVVYEAWLGV